jgi:hypothetical protein
MVLPACSGNPFALPGSTAQPAASPQATEPQSQGAHALPSLAQLDVLSSAARARLTASSTEPDQLRSIVPESRLDISDNVVIGMDGKATLSATSNDLSWIMFEAFNASGECEKIEVFGELLKAQVWIAVADFAAGRWRFMGPYGPFDPQISIVLDKPEYYSPLHRQYFAVLATAGGQLILSHVEMSLEVSEPVASVVASAALDGLELLECQGLPAVTYVDDTGQLTFAIADELEPAGPLDWRRSHIDNVLGSCMSMTLHNGRPVVLYTNAIDGSLNIAVAKVDLPLQDSDWQIKALVTDADCLYCSVASDGEFLYIAYYDNDDIDADADLLYGYLGFCQSDGADPLGDYTHYRITPLGNGIGAAYAQPSIALIDGLPAIAIANQLPANSTVLNYFHSGKLQPLVSDWVMDELSNTARLPNVVLREYEGRPLIAWNGPVFMFTVGLVPHPQSALDWNTTAASGIDVFDSFSPIVNRGRVYYAVGESLTAPNNIAFVGCSPNSFEPNDDFLYILLTNVVSNYATVGEPVLRMAAVAFEPVLAYFDTGDGSINYVRLVYD